MFRFFRQIRHKLFQEGKVSRYLGYAVGEIVLIVVGILIALQINEWNVIRYEAGLEQQYIRGIMDDIDSDLRGIEISKRYTEFRVGFMDLMMRAVSDANIAREYPTEFMIGLREVVRFINPTLTTDTVDELRSSGYLRILDRELKALLLGYYKMYERYRQNDRAVQAIKPKYLELVSGTLTYDQNRWLNDNFPSITFQLEEYRDLRYDPSEVEKAANRLSKNEPLVAYLPNVQYELIKQVEQMNALRDRGIEVQQLLLSRLKEAYHPRKHEEMIESLNQLEKLNFAP